MSFEEVFKNPLLTDLPLHADIRGHESTVLSAYLAGGSLYSRRSVLSIFCFAVMLFMVVVPEFGCSAGLAPESEKRLRTGVTIDAAENMGDMPVIFRAGVFEHPAEAAIPPAGRKYLKRKFFSDLSPGMTTIAIPLLEGDSFDDFKRLVEKEGILRSAVEEAKMVSAGGGKVLFDLQMMPAWLSSKRASQKGDYFRYPPRNYDTWKQLVTYITGYLYGNGIRGAGYRIWEEVDIGLTRDLSFWYGSTDDFCRLYEYSARGIRSVDPDAKVTFGLSGYSNDILPAVARCVSRKDLPLDYVIWHPFRTAPYSHEYEYDVRTINKTLKDAGVKRHAGVHAESWNSWLAFGRPNLPNGWPDERSTERDTEYNAAFAAQSLYALDGGGVEGQSFFSRVDFSYMNFPGSGVIAGGQQFYGDFGMFTRDLVIKPVFNSFRAISLLSGGKEHQAVSRIRTDFDETDFITAVSTATKDKKKVRVLLSNYVPPDTFIPKIYRKRKQSRYFHERYGEELDPMTACLSAGKTMKDCSSRAPKDLRPFLTCIADSEADKCVSELPEHVVQFMKDYDEFIRQQKERPKEVTVNFKNLPFTGKALITTYTIDKARSNSCRYNKRTEARPTGSDCGINGAVDTAVRQARREAEEAAQAIVKKHPTLSPKMSDISDALFYIGEYTAPDGREIKTSISVDAINNDPNVSLEGSRHMKEVTIEKSGSYRGTIPVQPNSVVLIEVEEARS